MASQPSLASSQPPQPVDLARQQIERLVRERLVGRRIDGIGFVDELLAITPQVSELCCRPAADRGLRFELRGHDPFEVELDANRGKLRMLCARLAVLFQESGHDPMLYGGEGTLCRTYKGKADLPDSESEEVDVTVTWKARWSNTPDKHEFSISVVR